MHIALNGSYIVLYAQRNATCMCAYYHWWRFIVLSRCRCGLYTCVGGVYIYMFVCVICNDELEMGLQLCNFDLLWDLLPI